MWHIWKSVADPDRLLTVCETAWQTRTACCPGPEREMEDHAIDSDDIGLSGEDGGLVVGGIRPVDYAAGWEPNDEHEMLCML